MRNLTTVDWLRLWEDALHQDVLHRALVFISAGWSELSLESAARLSIGHRNNLLLTMRERTFGSQIHCLTHCPCCKTQIELAFAVNDIRTVTREAELMHAVVPIGEWLVHVRAPNSFDLDVAASEVDLPEARLRLLERCIMSVEPAAQALHANVPDLRTWDTPAVDAICSVLEQIDPQALIKLGMNCPACGHAWQTPFDIASFLWTELSAWAQRILREVHVLAASYGWCEADILSMSTTRRNAYLKLVTGA
jgi:hypothetical protein